MRALRRSVQLRWLPLALLLFLAGCSHRGQVDDPTGAPDQHRKQLAIGYTLLYQEADGIPKLGWLLTFRKKPEEMARLTDDLTSFYRQLAHRLEQLSKQYPAVRIDVEPMSRIEAETRKAIGADLAKDLAPLVGENRVLVRRGLRQIRETKRQGLFSLAGVADMKIDKVTAGNIGFMLGPRLNASGRLESALASFELLTTTDFMRAGQLALQLDSQNRQRQSITRAMQEQAEAIAMGEDPEAFLLFAAHEEFNPGVVGLAASRLTEMYYRPAIVAAKNAEETRGSCRSIPEFHITDALDLCKDLLVRHGGHAAAAGFTVKNENLAELVSRLKGIAKDQLGSKDLRQTLSADMEVPLSQLNFEVLEHLKFLEPTGYGNPEAVFVSRNVKVKMARTVGSEGRHLKLTLEDERGVTVDSIGFRMGQLKPDLPPYVDVLYHFEANEYNGRKTLQLNLKDVKPAGLPD